MAKIQAEILTVMFVDMVGYTSTTSKLNTEEFHQLHDVFDHNISSVVAEYEGFIVKKLGDAFLITFKSSTNAVLCGKALQLKFRDYNAHSHGKHISIRVAIHAGEIVHRKGDIYGDVVNVTSRIEGMVKPGDVVYSQVVYSSMNKNEIHSKHIGVFKFDGVEKPMNLFKIKSKQDFIIEEKIRKMKRNQRIFGQIKYLLVLLTVFGALGFLAYLILNNWEFLTKLLS